MFLARLFLRTAPLLALLMSLLVTNAQAQCPRSWTVSADGVYGAASGYSQVSAMTSWTPSGSSTPVLVVGGNFLAAGEQSANNVAYWDGSLWHSLGQGFNAPVNALAVLNGVLYAGGQFTSSGATTLHYFAYWTGTAWQDAAFGTDAPVWSLTNNGSELLVGGSFTHEAGGLFVFRFLARYSASGWDGYTASPPGYVRSIVLLNGQPVVIVEQSGTSGADVYTECMYKWNGSQWVLVDRLYGAGDMAVVGGSLFYSCYIKDIGAGGACLHIGEYGIKRYDGTTLSTSLLYRDVSSYTFYNGQLYALGYARHICPYAFDGIPDGVWMATWNGSQWLDVSSIDPGFASGVLGSANGVLYVGGEFDHVGTGTQATNIARFISLQWQPLAVGLDGPVTCSQPGSLHVGGSFTHEGASSMPYEAAWNGQVWASTTAFNGPVTSLTNYSANPLTLSSLVASGSFTQIAGTPFNHIAVHAPFAGSWTAMGTGIDAPALATMPYNTSVNHADLYVGGQFITAGGVTVNRIARWSGGAWSALGTGMNGDVRALANFNGLIVAGGSFTTAGGTAAGYIAGWNGSAWAPIGGGMNGAVRCLLLYNGQLLAGGDFTVAGGVAASHLAAWNGTSWSAFNGGVNGTVNAMLISGTELIVGGSFSRANGTLVAAANLADWDGTEWLGMGDTDGPVLTLSLSSGTLLAGGSFTHVGGQYSPSVALAVTSGSPVVTQEPADASACPGQNGTFAVGINPGGWFVGITYNWYHDGYLVSDGVTPAGSVHSGSHTNTLIVSNATPSDAGGYWCQGMTACGQPVSSNTVQFTVGGAGCSTCGSADFNCDGDLGTDSDIAAFFACLSGSCPPPPCTSTADFNGDGDLGTDADIEAFFRVLGGGSC